MKKVIFLFFALTLLCVILIVPNKLKIKSIECKSQYGPCSQDTLDLFTNLPGKSYLNVQSEINKRLKGQKDITAFSVKFIFPDKLLVEVIEKKAAVCLTVDKQKFYLVDKSGLIIDEADKSNLPCLLIDPSIQINLVKGQRLSSDFQFASQLMQKMYLVYNTNFANVSADSVTFDLNGKKVIFPMNGDIDVLLGSLTVILSRLNSENNYSIIDLRYKNPVLK